jgi:hypothetical protein
MLCRPRLACLDETNATSGLTYTRTTDAYDLPCSRLCETPDNTRNAKEAPPQSAIHDVQSLKGDKEP